MVVGPIPKSSIDKHVEGWYWDDAEVFRQCMRAMDSIYLNHKPSKDRVVVGGDMTPQQRLDAIFGKAN